MKKERVIVHGIPVKKQFGQHFLRDQSVVDAMLARVSLTLETSVFEIGCGDGFLTRSILAHPIKKLWVFEIDPEWVSYVRRTYPDSRMTIFHEDILSTDFTRFKLDAPWVLLANLPYQITFPLFKLLYEHRMLLKEGVVMVQEEVAQKIVAQAGDATPQSLFYGHYFEWELLTKIPPAAFYPPPAVNSRLIYFKPRAQVAPIPDEQGFWRFVKLCFMHRRRTLKNNLQQTHYPLDILTSEFASRRAQELGMDDFLALWQRVHLS